MSEVKKNSELSYEELQAQVAELQKKLKVETKARSEAEELASAVAQAGQFSANTEEQPTGRTISIEVCLNPGEKDEKKQKWKTVEYPTYYYTIQLPTGAGLDLTTNGVAYYHGQTYEVDPMTLVDLKSRVARCWEHEKSIHGDNENAYRRPTQNALISAAARARGAR
jgi:hypothetical protein